MNNELLSVFETINDIAGFMQEGNILPEDELNSVIFSVEGINTLLFGTKKLKFQTVMVGDTCFSPVDYGKELEDLVCVWKEYEEKSYGIKVDVDFWKMYFRFKYVDRDVIINDAINSFEKIPLEVKDAFLELNRRYTFLTASLDYKNHDYSIIEQHTDMMIGNVEKYRWIYERMGDYRSKEVLNGIIRYWFNLDIQAMHYLGEYLFCDYYDLDIIGANPNETMVDCGAFTGDSVLDFIKVFNTYNHIYAFEMTPQTYGHMVSSLSKYENISCINKAVGDKNCTISINDGIDNAGNNIFTVGNTQIEMVSLDEEIKNPVSIIKMDIEGAEKSALIGARNHIINEKPKLLISAYHIPTDIFDIPILINDIRDDYKFYLRLNGRGIWPCDYVLFAV